MRTSRYVTKNTAPLGKPRARDLVTDLLAWQTIACTFLTIEQKSYIAERVEWERRGMPSGFRFTVLPRPQ